MLYVTTVKKKDIWLESPQTLRLPEVLRDDREVVRRREENSFRGRRKEGFPAGQE
jgi:hypothetical protein